MDDQQNTASDLIIFLEDQKTLYQNSLRSLTK